MKRAKILSSQCSMATIDKLASQIKSYYRKKNMRAIFQIGAHSKIIIISQAPGKKVDETGIPWNDASGKKLKEWLGITDREFYNPEIFSIMPMDFCYPGKGPKGDLPPRPECADKWHGKILKNIEGTPMKLLIGKYAIDYYLGEKKKETITETVKHYKEYLPEFFPLIHPSPRNIGWQKKNPWFEKEAVKLLQKTISKLLEE